MGNEQFLISRIRHYLDTIGPHTMREIATHLKESMETVSGLLKEMSMDGSVHYRASSGLWKFGSTLGNER